MYRRAEDFGEFLFWMSCATLIAAVIAIGAACSDARGSCHLASDLKTRQEVEVCANNVCFSPKTGNVVRCPGD